jgi:hypothetical protein
VQYKWEEGTSVHDYADAAIKWGKHTDTTQFYNKFIAIVDDVSLSNDVRAANVEAFMLQEAVQVGVVKRIELK